jgi:hypothetical protein
MLRTGTGRGPVVGTVEIGLYASDRSTVEACSVHWDGHPARAAALPSVALDEHLGHLRAFPDGGQLVYGPQAKRLLIDERRGWLDGALANPTPAPRFGVLEIVPEHDDDLVGLARMRVRVNAGKRRLWSETDVDPESAGDIASTVLDRVLFDWALSRSDLPVGPGEMLGALGEQLTRYELGDVPHSFWLRELGTVPFDVWEAHAKVRVPGDGR